MCKARRLPPFSKTACWEIGPSLQLWSAAIQSTSPDRSYGHKWDPGARVLRRPKREPEAVLRRPQQRLPLLAPLHGRRLVPLRLRLLEPLRVPRPRLQHRHQPRYTHLPNVTTIGWTSRTWEPQGIEDNLAFDSGSDRTCIESKISSAREHCTGLPKPNFFDDCVAMYMLGHAWWKGGLGHLNFWWAVYPKIAGRDTSINGICNLWNYFDYCESGTVYFDSSCAVATAPSGVMCTSAVFG